MFGSARLHQIRRPGAGSVHKPACYASATPTQEQKELITKRVKFRSELGHLLVEVLFFFFYISGEFRRRVLQIAVNVTSGFQSSFHRQLRSLGSPLTRLITINVKCKIGKFPAPPYLDLLLGVISHKIRKSCRARGGWRA